MQRLRVLNRIATTLAAIGLAAAGAAASAPAPGATPPVTGVKGAPGGVASPGAATPPAAAGPSGAAPIAVKLPPLKAGDAFDVTQPFQRVFPTPGTVSLMPRNGRPLLVLLWGTSAGLSRDELVSLDEWMGTSDVKSKMDVYAVAGYKADRQKPEDVRDMLAILGVKHVPVLCDPDIALANRIGCEQYPEFFVVDKNGRLVVKAIRGMDHDHLGEPPTSFTAFLASVAAKGTADPILRPWPFYPSDRLLRHHYPDVELPRFSPAGWGKGPVERLSRLLSGKRPAVLFFFSSTCEHCQVDVPQLMTFLKAHPTMYDIVGITHVKNEQHRKISEAYFKEQGIPFPILEDVGVVNDVYKVTSTPTAFYLSPAGSVVSISYYQHENLAAEYLKLEPVLRAAPPPVPWPGHSGAWGFPLKVKDEKGKDVDLASFAGKPTIVHFWATWCMPCRQELPDLLKRLPELQKSANVVITSVEDDASKLAKYRKDTGFDLKSYLAPHDGLAKSIDFSRSVPRTYVLDKGGHVDTVYSGSYEWADDGRFTNVLGRLLKQ